MMTSRLRHLVLDPAPLWQNGVGLLLWLIVAFIAGVWMTGKGEPNIMMVFSASVVTSNYTLKTPVWRHLPLSRAELGQAQWWHLLGRPALCALASLALAVAGAAMFGALSTPPVEILAYGGAELSLIPLFGAAVLLAAQLAPMFGVGGYALGLGLPLTGALALGMRWMDKDLFLVHQGEMLTGGAMGLMLMFALYAASPWLPLALPKPPRLARAKSRDAAASKPGQPGLTGWGALARPALNRLAFSTGLSLLAVAVMFIVSDGASAWTPILGALPPAIVAITTQTTTPIRALAGLPLTPAARTVVLQASAPLLQLPVFALMWGLTLLIAPATLTPMWLAAYGLTALALLAAASVSLALQLRFGVRASVALVGVLAGLMGVNADFMAATGGPALPAAARVWMALLLCLLLAGGWVWTWAELAYGRAAYRQRPLTAQTWRGRDG